MRGGRKEGETSVPAFSLKLSSCQHMVDEDTSPHLTTACDHKLVAWTQDLLYKLLSNSGFSQCGKESRKPNPDGTEIPKVTGHKENAMPFTYLVPFLLGTE